MKEQGRIIYTTKTHLSLVPCHENKLLGQQNKLILNCFVVILIENNTSSEETVQLYRGGNLNSYFHLINLPMVTGYHITKLFISIILPISGHNIVVLPNGKT
jgi:hypothetical protein